MYASTHPWRSAAVSLCGAAGLALAVGLGAAMETGAPALELASDAVVMPSATPLPAEPASTELDVPAADGAQVPLPSSSPASDALPADGDAALDGDAAVAPPAPPGSSSSATSPDSAAAPDSAASPSSAAAPDSAASPAEEMAPGVAEEPAVTESAAAPAQTSRQPMVGPPMPTNGDLDCADFERQSFPIDPANDPHNLDADGDGIACEPPPDE